MLDSKTGLELLLVIVFCLLAISEAFGGGSQGTTTHASANVPATTNPGQLIFAAASGIGGIYFIIKSRIKK